MMWLDETEDITWRYYGSSTPKTWMYMYYFKIVPHHHYCFFPPGWRFPLLPITFSIVIDLRGVCLFQNCGVNYQFPGCVFSACVHVCGIVKRKKHGRGGKSGAIHKTMD